MRHSVSIRLRLTLLYSAIVALTVIAFSIALYAMQSHATFDSIKSNLVRQAQMLTGPRGGPPGEPGAPPPAETPPEDVTASSPTGTSLPGRWAQIRTIDGTVARQTVDLGSTPLPLSQKGLQAVQAGASWFETAQVDDEPLLIYSRPFMLTDGMVQIVQVAFPIAQPLQSMKILRVILLVGSSLVLLAAFASGWLLAGTALHPIHRITRTAQAIGSERDFSRRVEHEGPADEIGQLAVTFNQMLAELESSYRQVESALGSQRRFVADASHELRTPLTTVRGNIELLRRDPPVSSEEQAEILADTTAEVERLIRLVGQLLTLARADAGLTLQHEPVPLKALLDDVYRQARLLSPHCPIHYEPPPEEMVIQGDHDALKQVLLILIDNAHVHTAPGTVIDVSTRLADGRVAISVHDSGPGMVPDMLPHIFERFYQGYLSRNDTGTGLGLAIAKELVERQGGTISVESEIGQGSVFTVTLLMPDALGSV